MYLKDHPSENIYFVNEGIVLMSIQEFDDVPIDIYNQGEVFGEFEVYKNTPRLFSCSALTNVRLLILDKKKFKYLFFKAFPKIGKEFIDQMEKKFEKLETVMNQVIPLVTYQSSVGLIQRQFFGKEAANIFSKETYKEFVFKVGRHKFFRAHLLA